MNNAATGGPARLIGARFALGATETLGSSSGSGFSGPWAVGGVLRFPHARSGIRNQHA